MPQVTETFKAAYQAIRARHCLPEDLPVYFVGEFENEAGEAVYICEWAYYRGGTIGYEISRDAAGHTVGSYTLGETVDRLGWTESDTMTVAEMVVHVLARAAQHLDRLTA